MFKFLKQNVVSKSIRRIQRKQGEILYGIKFNNVICECEWLQKKNFAPGGWAMGYPGLYIMFRAIEAIKPMNILELGLGETTRMLGQYAYSDEKICHKVVEHDGDWINFYAGEKRNSHVFQKTLVKKSYNGFNDIVMYENFDDKKIKGDNKYDLVVVDAPYGSDGISRVDVLELIEDNLQDEFAIIIDDSHREGEKRTIKLIEEKLKQKDISFKKGVYSGEKDTTIIVSQSYSFLASLQ